MKAQLHLLPFRARQPAKLCSKFLRNFPFANRESSESPEEEESK